MGHRVARLPGTPASIAAGFACGAAASFTPLVGFHFLLAALLAWVSRGNLIASAIGTVVGNPWTFPFIWVATFEIGCMMTGGDGNGATVNFAFFFQSLWHSVVELDLRYFVSNVLPIWVPMLLGSLPLGLLAFCITYWPVKRAVAGYQRARVAARHRKALERVERRQRQVDEAQAEEQLAEALASRPRGDLGHVRDDCPSSRSADTFPPGASKMTDPEALIPTPRKASS